MIVEAFVEVLVKSSGAGGQDSGEFVCYHERRGGQGNRAAGVLVLSLLPQGTETEVGVAGKESRQKWCGRTRTASWGRDLATSIERYVGDVRRKGHRKPSPVSLSLPSPSPGTSPRTISDHSTTLMLPPTPLVELQLELYYRSVHVEL